MIRNIPLTTLAAGLALALGLGAPAARAAPLIGGAGEIVADPLTGLALGGFDPVSYFLPGGPRPGRRELDHLWGGAAWRFAGEANREAFRRAPEAYAPRLGGHDPEAAARGLLVAADPGVFAVRDGRLYLFRTPGARERFLADPALAGLAEARWGSLRGELVAAP